MIARKWYMGPLGDLRPLTVPDSGIEMTNVRYGGTHQGLSGARVTDVTGHRREYNFQWSNLEYSEWRWLEAMHTRLIPGPFFLNDPTRKNLLSVQSSTLEAQIDNVVGAGIAYATYPTRQTDWPSAVDLPGRSQRFAASPSGSQIVRFDRYNQTGVLDEDLVASMYMKSSSAKTVQLVFDWYDITGAHTSSTQQACNVTTSWQRFEITRNPPAATAAMLALIIPLGTEWVQIAAPQLEYGTTATAWQIGGGSACVILDQLTNNSPNYEHNNISMTLLEA